MVALGVSPTLFYSFASGSLPHLALYYFSVIYCAVSYVTGVVVKYCCSRRSVPPLRDQQNSLRPRSDLRPELISFTNDVMKQDSARKSATFDATSSSSCIFASPFCCFPIKRSTNRECTNMSSSKGVDVLIIGSGPVGLTAAVEAARLGLSARIIEQKAERSSHDSRALVVHARVMELLEPLGDVTEKIKERSIQGGKMRICFAEDDQVVVSFDEGNWGDTLYPSPYFLPQYETETILEEELNANGRSVEYGMSLEALEQDDVTGVVRSTLRCNSDGTEEIVTSKYVVGCDGGRSKTRESLGIELRREQSEVYFIVADVKLTMSPFEDDGPRTFLHATGASVFLQLPGNGNYRLVFQTPEGVTDKSDVDLNKEFIENLLHERTGLIFGVELGAWRTIFKITHGVADSFSKGRVFLAGDACHIHSPVGGQGMNYGMQDAFNLMWKLAWAERAVARDPSSKESVKFILDTYNDERHTVGAALIQGVGVATQVVSTRNWFLQTCRNFIMRNAIPLVSKNVVRKLGQLELKYDPSCSPIILEKGGWTSNYICKPGERLPNLRLEDGSVLHSHVDRVHHTWIYLNMEEPSQSTHGSDIKMTSVVPMDEKHQTSAPSIPQSTLKQRQIVLVRPDLFVAGVDKDDKSLWERLRNNVDENSLETM